MWTWARFIADMQNSFGNVTTNNLLTLRYALRVLALNLDFVEGSTRGTPVHWPVKGALSVTLALCRCEQA